MNTKIDGFSIRKAMESDTHLLLEPSIPFYRRMGAGPMSEWTTYREEGEARKKLAGQF